MTGMRNESLCSLEGTVPPLQPFGRARVVVTVTKMAARMALGT